MPRTRKRKDIKIENFNYDKDFHSENSFDIYECFPSDEAKKIIDKYQIPFAYKGFTLAGVRINMMTSVIIGAYEDAEKNEFKLKYYKIYLTHWQLEAIMLKMKECFEKALKI